MTRKKITDRYQIQSLEKLDAIHKQQKKTNEFLDDLIESKKTDKAELSFILSLVGVGISVSSLLIRSLSGDSRILLFGGGISLLLLFNVVMFMRRAAKNRPVPLEIILILMILFAMSVYTLGLGLEWI
jgi:hypothetical protein